MRNRKTDFIAWDAAQGAHPRARARSAAALLAVLCSTLLCAGAQADEAFVPMRDGLEIRATILLPEQTPAPVILIRTPYGRAGYSNTADTRALVENGYAVVVTDVRGRYSSPGVFTPFFHEADDGLDTLDWVLEQPWCNGVVGAAGSSYVGYTQWAMTARPTPGLKAMIPEVTTADIGKLAWRDGALSLLTTLSWGLGARGRTTDLTAYMHAARGFKTLPLIEADDVAVEDVPFLNDWYTTPYPMDYWRPVNHAVEWESKPPAFMVAGWFDLFLGPQLEDFIAITTLGDPETGGRSRIVIGPWDHSKRVNRIIFPMDLGPEADRDLTDERIEWYDYWLKGEENGAERRPRVEVFVMGADRWRAMEQWPPPEVEYTPFYFGGQGGAERLGVLSTTAPGPDEPPDSFVYDPADPMPSRGGTVLGADMGPRNVVNDEERGDLLIYTSPPLEAPLEIVGPVTVVLWAASTACDTDFTARLVDITPDGKSIVYATGVLRASFRDPDSAPQPIEPGRPVRYEIDLWSTAMVFMPGHRIRVHISSSNFPQWDRNLNECSFDFGRATEFNTATQTVFHDSQRPSHLLLPVMPH